MRPVVCEQAVMDSCLGSGADVCDSGSVFGGPRQSCSVEKRENGLVSSHVMFLFCCMMLTLKDRLNERKVTGLIPATDEGYFFRTVSEEKHKNIEVL